jgi:NAD(P)H-hydrate epimerase
MTEIITDIPTLPEREKDGHKGTFGRVGVVGGCAAWGSRMVGAPALAAWGAIRSGCGMVRIAAPEPVLDAVLALAPFATGVGLPAGDAGALDAAASAERFDGLCAGVDVLCVGMGLGASAGAAALVLRAAAQEDAPVVVDADGLNLLAATPEFWREVRASLVLTPHPGEAARLMKALGLRGEPGGSDDQRVDACAAMARRLGCVVVLKGKGTVVSDGLRAWVCRAGHPCLGVGGTGDVLAGMIAGVMAQVRGTIDLFGCAQVAVEAHARAGAAWAEQSGAAGGMTPMDLADLVPVEIEASRGG